MIIPLSQHFANSNAVSLPLPFIIDFPVSILDHTVSAIPSYDLLLFVVTTIQLFPCLEAMLQQKSYPLSQSI